MRRIVHLAQYLALRLVVAVVQFVPPQTCQRIARRLAGWLADWLRPREDVLAENLSVAFPDWSPERRQQVIRQMWEHLLLMFVEVCHAPRKIHETNWRDYISFRDVRAQTSLLLDERPMVLVSAHLGNFELGGYVSGLLGIPTYTVARSLDNPYIDAWLNRFREANGTTIIAKKGASEEIARLLAAGGKVVLLGDQYAGTKGCWVEFFGREASTHKAIALLTLGNGIPLVVHWNRRPGDVLTLQMGVEAIYDPAVDGEQDVKSLTQWYTRQLETAIVLSPGQYWWVHRRWKDRRERRRRTPLAA